MKIGVIGGSGLDDPDIIKDLQSENQATAYGETAVNSGKLNGIDIVFVPRHGIHHQFSPTHVNYRANIQALKDSRRHPYYCDQCLRQFKAGNPKRRLCHPRSIYRLHQTQNQYLS